MKKDDENEDNNIAKDLEGSKLPVVFPIEADNG